MKTKVKFITWLMKVLHVSTNDFDETVYEWKNKKTDTKETKPAPKPEPKPAPKPEPKPAPKPEPEPKPAPKPEPKPAPKPETKSAPEPETALSTAAKIKFLQKGGMTYAQYEGKVLGIVIEAGTGKFVFALRANGYNKPYQMAKEEAAALPAIEGKKWMVPSDEHFKAIVACGTEKVDKLLKELGGQELFREGGYLSSTSQANPPQRWEVRFILPLN